MEIDTIGYIACVITIVYTSFGLPNQILKNYKLKSTASLSLMLFVLLFFTFSSWVVYGIIKPDWFVAIPNALGAFFAFILVCQIIYYSNQQK